MHVYHYTRYNRWKYIKESGSLKNPTYALFDPVPTDWQHEVWENLQGYIGDLLIEIDIDPQKDSVLVRDFEGMGRFGKTRLIDEYLERKNDLQYSTPEVIICQTTPLENLRLADRQPLLERKLLPTRLGKKYELKTWVRDLPELKPWADRYASEHFPAQEGSRFFRR